MRAFVVIRQLMVNIAAKLAELESKISAHDEQLAAVINVLRHLTASEGRRHRREIGFHQGNR